MYLSNQIINPHFQHCTLKLQWRSHNLKIQVALRNAKIQLIFILWPYAIKRKLYTQKRVKSMLLYPPLFWPILYDRYIPMQTLYNAVNVMLTVPR